MARTYDVVCKECGAKWEWCKYDEPDDECPECGELLTTKDYDETEWDEDKVIIFGVGSTNLDVEQAIRRIKESA